MRNHKDIATKRHKKHRRHFCDFGAFLWLSFLIFGLAAASVAAEKPSLADAAEQRNRTLIRTLLDSGADVNAAQADGTTALHWAVYNDDTETAALLVKRGANVNTANRYGVPPLSLACTNGNADLVKLLLDAGADANASLQGGETVLMTAARAGNLETVKALLARGANPNARERRDQTDRMVRIILRLSRNNETAHEQCNDR